MSLAIFIILAYLLGSIPFGLIITRAAGRGDIRTQGSGNIGSTNVTRTAGKMWGLLTLILDAMKGVLAIIIAQSFLAPSLLIIVGIAAILGHIFPVWLNFKGGKGVATALAVWLVINWQFGLIICATWLLAFLIFRISGLSAIIAFLLAPVYAYYMGLPTIDFITSILISTVILIRHISNIKNLLKLS